ncbi:sulfotransferase family 2 domain-containing protein [Shewanella goraebulensis]|uniref:sulfotransferase family 2 domain-containing protein n=1 Tax=Shewanella goraebulensis TaxID=3050637 RepID=UPI00254FF07B|nr:sulfotransferase family 2 domain-containing protein [Shewanella goraebulensis]
MLVSHRKNFIYLKTVKTASTSLESYFEKYCMPEGDWEELHHREEYSSDAGVIGCRGPNCKGSHFYNHIPANILKGRLDIDIWNSYFKFCSIRNPFDKLVSAYYHFVKSKNQKLINQSDDIQAFRHWLQAGKLVNDKPVYCIDSIPVMDFFIRYEHLSNDVEHVCNILDIPYLESEIPSFKRGFRNNDIELVDFYDVNSLEIVKSFYGFELEYFNYSLKG